MGHSGSKAIPFLFLAPNTFKLVLYTLCSSQTFVSHSSRTLERAGTVKIAFLGARVLNLFYFIHFCCCWKLLVKVEE